MLGRLKATTESDPTVALVDDEDGAVEEFWPAESWREIVDGDAAHERQEISSNPPQAKDEGLQKKDGLGIWHLLMDDVGAEDWDGWIADGKWCVAANMSVSISWRLAHER